MKLPLLVSVPHAGLAMPRELEPYAVVSQDDVRRDGDEGAREIYYSLEGEVEAFVGTDIARAYVDLNRATNDRRPDGVFKTETCFEVPIYDPFPPEELIERVLESYWRPYHEKLSRLAGEKAVHLGVDCHTMLAVGPPIGPGPGLKRPLVCLSNGEGTCPEPWMERLAQSFRRVFGEPEVTVNHPFRGGYIVRSHAAELPWVQLELSRTPELTDTEKKRHVLWALREFCAHTWPGSA